MNSIQSQKIGLCIAGTKSRQGGFTPFVISGILAGNEASNMDRVTLVVEKPVYVIKHTNEYILYLLIDRKVKPCDRDTFGVLSIALTIARDMRLADGKSPYTLLKEVYDKFRSDYMESDGNECDRFINKDVNSADFASIMEQYPVEKRSFDEYVTMNPSGLAGTLCVPQEKMEELFRDSQYSEFAQFKEVEIGSRCQTTPGLEHIEIPRPVVYSIKVGDRAIKETMSRPDDFFDTASVLHNTPDIMYDNLSFCLEELLNAPEYKIQSGQSSVTLDMEGRCIKCEIQKKEIKYSLEYRIEGGTEKERKELGYLLLDKKVKLTMGKNVIEFSSSSPKKTFIPASVAQQNVGLQIEQRVTFAYRVTSNVDDENKHVMVTITIHTPKRDPYSGGSTGYQGRRYDLNVPATTQIYSGERIENDHEEDLEKLRSSNEQPSQKQPSNKTKKRWILLGVCCLVSMCIGAGIVGAIWWFGGNKKQELTPDDLVNFAKDTLLKNPDAIITQEMIKRHASLRVYIKKIIDEQEGEIVDSTVTENVVDQAKTEIVSEEGTNPSPSTIATPTPLTQTTNNNAEDEKEKAREEILDLVNNKNYKGCEKHSGWKKYIEEQERWAIYNLLVIEGNQNYKNLNTYGIEALKKLTSQPFDDFEELMNANDKIQGILNKKQNQTKEDKKK